MDKKIIFTILLIAAFTILGTIRNNKKNDSSQFLSAGQQKENTSIFPQQKPIMPADKIEVVHFHGTHQCWSCIKVGEYALKTIKEKFPKEYASGKIVFRDINGELPENRDIVVRYQARGSSLFINAIRDKQDNIQEEIKVWYLVNDKEQFMKYFESRLNYLLGG